MGKVGNRKNIKCTVNQQKPWVNLNILSDFSNYGFSCNFAYLYRYLRLYFIGFAYIIRLVCFSDTSTG